MKTHLFSLFRLIVSVALLLAVLPGGITCTAAAGPEPPEPTGSRPGSRPQRAPDGTWYMPAANTPPGPSVRLTAEATGGPDDFGYTWDDALVLNWIDATSGTELGMSGGATGPVSLPFSFQYYENTYTSLYIAANGYVGFTDSGWWDSQPRVPSPARPNNLIAPYATPLNLASSGPADRVYYKSGGAAPNRYFVVEWYQARMEDEVYTFEVVLHENGDVVFQYQAMTYVGGGYMCGAAGIEDSTGQDGLAYVKFCEQAPSSKAVRFFRPVPSARAGVKPAYQGRFTQAGEVVTFQVPIRNTGDLGADTYDVLFTSTWPVTLYAADGTAPLSDTDGDGAPDTDLVVPGGSATFVARVSTPAVVNVGDRNIVSATVRSSLNTGISRIVTLQTAVPAPFAQIWRDNANGAMALYLVQPDSQTLRKTTPDGYYGDDMAVAEMPSGFAYFWSGYRGTGSVGVREIEYTLLDRNGNTVRAVSNLTDRSAATVSTYDESPAVAVASNGHIGVLWYRYLYSSTGEANHNIYFAVLDSAGNLLYGPANLTNNAAWGRWDDLNVPQFYNPRIAATADNRFVLAWERQSQQAPAGSCSSSCYLEDVYYGVRNTDGGEVKGTTRFTNGVPGGDYYYGPATTALSGNRALLAYRGPSGITYAVLDSGGNLVRAATPTGGYGWAPDAVQLSTGNIILAWSAWGESIDLVVLDGSSYNVVAGPASLHHPAAVTGDGYVSVAADRAGHAILTWTDDDWDFRRNLYYALVDGAGNVLTDPLLFRTSQATTPYLETSYEGYGNTSYNKVTPRAGVDLVVSAPALAAAAPGGLAAARALVSNHGTTTATSIVLTATLDSSLAYAGAWPAPSSVVTPTVVWTLADMGFLGHGQVTLYANVPSATVGTHYPITWAVGSASTDASPADNTATTEVMVSQQVFLPLVLKGH